MSFAEKVQCCLCEKEESLLWHQCDKGVRCNECHESVTSMKSEVDASEDQEQDPPDDIKSKKRNKNNRRCTASQKSTSTPRQVTNKSKSRRTAAFKENPPYKSPSAAATYVMLENTVCKGQLFTIGDVVSVISTQNGQIYYAQITGLMFDELHGETSCSITWLLPSRNDHNHQFDPMTFKLGPADAMPRSLDCLTFVMHCPINFFRLRDYLWQPNPTFTRGHGSN